MRAGRLDDAIASIDKAVPACRNIGTQSMALQLIEAGGPLSGHLVMLAGFDSLAARGRCADAAARDPEIAAITQRHQAPDSPIETVNVAILTSVPL